MGRIPFPWAYWAAHLGLMLSYVPLFGLFLPVRVAQISAAPITDQAAIVLIGSIVASLAGVMAGRLSDAVFKRTGTRRPMLWAGLVTISGSYALFAWSNSIAYLIAAVVVLQIGINLALGGLNALFAHHVAPQNKPQLASIVNLGLPLANLGLLMIGSAGANGMGLRLALLALLVSGLFLPILTWRAQVIGPEGTLLERPSHWLYDVRPAGHIWIAIFTARSLVQLSAALLLTFAQPYLVAIWPETGDIGANDLLLYIAVCAAIVSIPLSLGAAHLAVRRVNPLALLQGSALALACAMMLFTLSAHFVTLVLGYTLFMSALVTYLAIDTAVIAQWLAQSRNVATRLGMMNLANTVPGIFVPAFVVLADGPGLAGLSAAFVLTAMGSGIAVLLIAFAKYRLRSSP